MKSVTGDYHLLIAHNFLSSISLDGSYCDTNLHVLKSRNVLEVATTATEGGGVSLPTNKHDDERAILLGVRNLCSSAPGGSGGRTYAPSTVKNKLPKPFLLKRFGRMISSDDTLVEEKQSVMEEKASTTDSAMVALRPNRRSDSSDHSTFDDRTMSSFSGSHFTFLRLLRTSLAKDGRSRSFLCTASGAPLIVISHFPFQRSTRERSRFHYSRSSIGSSERMHQIKRVASIEELRPFDFKDVKYIYFDQLGSQLRRSSVSLSGVAWKSLYKDETKTNDVQTNQRRPHSITGSLNDGVKSAGAGEDAVDESDSYQLDTDISRCNDYDPLMLDEVASATQTIIRTNGFIGVTKLFAPTEVAKTMLNDRFAEKFPNIHLTYSKLRSIKRDVWQIAKECGVDECTVAHAYVYFERIAIKGLISKYNRKFVAGTALLVAVKLNDYKKPVIVKVLQSAEELLRISRREMLSFELPLCSALQFDLFPPSHHVEPHLRKLMFGVF